MMRYDSGKYLSIGEFANLLNTTRATLVHYDDQGILKPAKVGENGYRYYLPDQAQTYMMILLFAECGLTLKDIKGYLETHDEGHGKKLVEEALDTVNDRLRQLNQVKRLMESKRGLYNIALERRYETPFFEHFDEKLYFRSTIRGISKTSRQLQTDHSISICRYVMDHSKFPEHPFAAVINLENYDESEKWDISREEQRIDTEIYQMPTGLYACILHKGSRYTVESMLQKLVDFIFANGYTIAGDMYMIDTVNFVITDNEDEYSTLFQILVEKD